MNQVEEFNNYRTKMNERLTSHGHKNLNRFFNLDTNTYKSGALGIKTKELLGLVASMVLRCDDCIKYHIEKCFSEGVTKDELFEVFMIANLVGGSICIPHTRKALEFWEVLESCDS